MTNFYEDNDLFYEFKERIEESYGAYVPDLSEMTTLGFKNKLRPTQVYEIYQRALESTELVCAGHPV